MERPCKLSPVVSFVVVLLSLVAFATCIAAEFEKNKVKDLKLDGRLCSLPESPAFGLGITASICLSIAQIVGTCYKTFLNTGQCKEPRIQLCSRKNKPAGQTRRTATPISLMVLSWISFGLAIILLGASSSMNSRQPYGKGWLDGNCYVVKDGVYSGAAVLVVATMIFILGFKRSMRSNTANRVMTEDGRG